MQRLGGLILMAVILASHVAGAQESTFVEGHVFSKFTGVPLRNALVTATEVRDFMTFVIPPPAPRIIARVGTDASGFYSFETDTPFDVVLIVTCLASRRPVADPHENITTIRPIRPGTIRRDIYINAGRKRKFADCGVGLERP